MLVQISDLCNFIADNKVRSVFMCNDPSDFDYVELRIEIIQVPRQAPFIKLTGADGPVFGTRSHLMIDWVTDLEMVDDSHIQVSYDESVDYGPLKFLIASEAFTKLETYIGLSATTN